MRSRGAVAAAALALAAHVSPAAEAPRTLPELLRAALATHELPARAESDVRRAEADVRLARSALLPRLELHGTSTRFQSELAWEVAPGQSFVIRPLSDWSWSADLTQTLFSGLRDWRARDLARVRAAGARIARIAARSELALEVAQAFYDALAAREAVAVRRAALEASRAQLGVARRRFEVGEVASADVLRLRARVAADRQALAEAEGARRLARRRLARLCGVDTVGELQPPPPVPVPAGETGRLVEEALARRPELAALDRELEAAGLMVAIERGARLPELEAHLQYYRQRSTFPSADWASLALTLRVPIYDGGLAAARTARAREDLVRARLLRRETARRIADQVDAAAIALHTAEAALEAVRERVAAAREAHRQTERAYRAGEATATDLLAAAADLADAEAAEVVARWQRELQAVALRHAVGLDPVPEPPTGTAERSTE